MKLLSAALLGVFVLNASAALAHGGPVLPWFGGQVAESGAWHVEFAVRDGVVRVWVRDHADQPVAATGKATVLLDGRKLDLPLKAEGDGLAAEAPVISGARLTAVLSLTASGQNVAARFAQEAVAVPALSAEAARGRQAFEQICSTCHGTALRGSDAGPPLLHAYYAPGAGHGDDVVLTAMAQGRQSHHWKFGNMPKPEGLKPGQDKDVLAYIRAMQAANGIAAAPAAAGHAGHMGH